MAVIPVIKQLARDFADLAFPNMCLGCGTPLNDSEHFVCIGCLALLAPTGMHLTEPNEVTDLFMNKTIIEHGCSYFKYIKNGLLQRLIHDLKYRNQPDVGILLGRTAAYGLKRSGIFNDVDCIVPVPLHPRKLKKRGYNQSEKIAVGMSQVLDIPIDTNVLIKTTYNETQTKKHRYERFLNSQNLFKAQILPEHCNKHFLIVDDVLTTGSTLESCINEIKTIPDAKVSVFTLARAME